MRLTSIAVPMDKWQKIKMIMYFVLGITGLIFLFWVMKLIYDKWFKPNSETEGKQEYAQEQTKEYVQTGINNELKAGVRLTYALPFYDQLANQLFTLLNGTFRAEHEDLQPLYLKCKNYLDLLQLQKSFGKREFDTRLTMNRWAETLTLNEAISLRADVKANIYYTAISKAFSEQLSKANKK